MVKLSIVIVNYNVEHFLEQCLHAVYKALNQVKGEVFVVDNNSVDGSVAMVKDKFPQVTLIENKKNFGFSFANNQAIKLAKGEYILLLNPDTIVEENTFKSTIDFMDGHPEAGGLGVKMLDGKGNFLPESKRGLPKPIAAFYKVFGLSALFPKSTIFGQYHLGFLDKDEIHTVDVLSGAFMLLRKSVLDKIGLLDEQFFMYGEDIDLSYRITQCGYKNYYFPKTRIIHYKGESTKKSSLNYVLVFYKAMIIFAQKHFSKNHAQIVSLLIHLAIYLRAGISIAKRFVQKMIIPSLDFALFFFGILKIAHIYEKQVLYEKGGAYSESLIWTALSGYALIWLLTIFFSGGYDKPVRLIKLWKGVVIGTAIILIIYSLLPEDYRFSRAIILLGTIWTLIALTSFRGLLHLLKIPGYNLNRSTNKRIVIVGSEEETGRVHELMTNTSIKTTFVGFVTDTHKNKNNNLNLGYLSQLSEICSIHQIDEIIFCAKDLSSQQIIEQMLQLGNQKIDYKIAPPESLSIIGSNSINTSGDMYVMDVNSVIKPHNKRNKRLLDVLTCFALFVFSPIFIFVLEKKGKFLSTIFNVFIGKKSWVGFESGKGFPSAQKGVLKPSDILKENELNESMNARINEIYIKDYSTLNDLKIIVKNVKKLGG